jgi:hypothetical protein
MDKMPVSVSTIRWIDYEYYVELSPVYNRDEMNARSGKIVEAIQYAVGNREPNAPVPAIIYEVSYVMWEDRVDICLWRIYYPHEWLRLVTVYY